MSKRTTFFALALAAVMSLGLFMISYQVHDLEDQLDGLNRDISRDSRAVHVLQAEWAHLNQPERLRDLALAVTDLRPLEPAQLVSVTSLAETLEEIEHTPTAPHCAGLEPPARKPTVDSNGILLVTYGLGGDPI